MIIIYNLWVIGYPNIRHSRQRYKLYLRETSCHLIDKSNIKIQQWKRAVKYLQTFCKKELTANNVDMKSSKIFQQTKHQIRQ